jgi:GNAT superfamily N-acetyltransferase
MCTSADPATPAQPPRVQLRAVGYDDPVAVHLVERVQQEYVVRYGGRDAAPVDPAEFSPPDGLFLVAEVDGVPVGCGGWRVHASGVAELKRMYVEPAVRRHGVARRLLTALESTAAAAGHRHLLLNSGGRQPEALALYDRAGYTPVPGYGVYAESPDAVFLGKQLGEDRPAQGEEDAWAS